MSAANPKAKAALDKEWNKLVNLMCRMRPCPQGGSGPRWRCLQLVFDVCVEKNSELPKIRPVALARRSTQTRRTCGAHFDAYGDNHAACPRTGLRRRSWLHHARQQKAGASPFVSQGTRVRRRSTMPCRAAWPRKRRRDQRQGQMCAPATADDSVLGSDGLAGDAHPCVFTGLRLTGEPSAPLGSSRSEPVWFRACRAAAAHHGASWHPREQSQER